MELNIKFNEKMLAEMANSVLDEYEYNGKTIREWADLITNPKTNADRFRSMTDEALAEWFGKIQYDTAYYCAGEDKQKYPYPDGWLDWLRQEVKEDE